jgi:hypothetical protein
MTEDESAFMFGFGAILIRRYPQLYLSRFTYKKINRIFPISVLSSARPSNERVHRKKLLRRARSSENRHRRRDKTRIPQTVAQIPPRPERRQRGIDQDVPGDQPRVRRDRRPPKPDAVRRGTGRRAVRARGRRTPRRVPGHKRVVQHAV